MKRAKKAVALHPKHAVGVDGDIKASNLARVSRIEGQVRGIAQMIRDERYCADILVQLSAVHQALRGVGRELMRNHLKHCATSAIRADAQTAEAMYDELIDLFYKNAK